MSVSVCCEMTGYNSSEMEPPAKRRKTGKNATLLNKITVSSELYGRGCKHIGDVPNHILVHLETNEHFNCGVIAYIVADMDRYLTRSDISVEHLYRQLKVLFEKLTCLDRRTPADELARFEPEDRNSEIFVLLGGIEASKRIIMFESLLPENSLHRHESEEKLRMKAVLFEVLSRVITTEKVGEATAIALATDEEFQVHMFTYLQYNQTFLSACTLIEDILQNKPVLTLSSIPNLKELISGFDSEKLCNFCKILAVTVSDLDVYDNKTSLFAQNQQKRQEDFVNIRDVNQEFLLGIPDLLKQLVSLACSKEYSPRYRGLNGEVENWMQWIDDSNSDDLLDMPLDDNGADEFIGAISQPSVPGGPWTRQPSMQCIMNLIYKVEAIYVLGLFLIGKHRKKAQKKLAELKLIPGLSDLFENFIWKVSGSRTAPRNRLRGHNASCECSPEVALKIQFLRLVHSFSDHSEYKHLLLTKSELNEVKKINEKAGILAIEGLDKVDKSLMCKGKEGLITKIVEVMKKEPTSSTFRFWLARSVESYLRGTTSFCDQVFLLRRGLLQHVVNNMLDSVSRPKEILQSGFDLLGELIKFNIEAFKIIDDVLRTPEMKKQFLDLANKNLVDSNMFIRSAILSYSFFANDALEHAGYAKNVNTILHFVGKFQHQINYLHEMINLTTVHSITQENVSCLNTTLVFLMCASKETTIEPYLQALAEERITYTVERKGGFTLMSNFRELLLFWKDHYLHKDKDCSALEKSSRIPFDCWKATVNSLLDDDKTQRTSLLYYIDNCAARSN